MSADRPLSVQIAAEVRKLLFLRDLTATQLGERAGMTQPYISRRLTGATKFDIDDLEKIATALDVEIADLLPRTDKAGRRAGDTTIYSPLGADGSPLAGAGLMPDPPIGPHIPTPRPSPRVRHHAETPLSGRRHHPTVTAGDRRTGRAHRPTT